jgi:hypothetical protein
MLGAQWHVLEHHFATLAGMRPVEIQRVRIEELELLVVLEQPLLLDKRRGYQVSAKLGLEPFPTIELAIEHSLCQRPVVRRNLVDEHYAREPVAPVVEAPTVISARRTDIAAGSPPAKDGLLP